MPRVKKKIRKKDADQRRMLLNWFKSKEGQEALQQTQQDEFMTDPYGRPISVMIPTAEVSTLGNRERDLSRDVLLGLREAAGFAPILGEGLDAAELAKISQTGEDFYGDEADPKVYAGLTAAGMLLPNIIERPARGALRLIKKGVQKLKGSGPNVVKKADVPKQAVQDTDTSDLPPRVLDETRTQGLESLPGELQSGVQFVRDFYKRPEVRNHFRKLAGVEYGNVVKQRQRQAAYAEASQAINRNLGGATAPDGTFQLVSEDPMVSNILERRAKLSERGFDNMSPAELSEYNALGDQMDARLKELESNIIKETGEKYGPDVAEAMTGSAGIVRPPQVFPGATYANQLEDVFRRGRTAPDMLADDLLFPRVVPDEAGGVFEPTTEAIAAKVLRKDGSIDPYYLEGRGLRWLLSTGAHEANHYATVKFLREKQNPFAQKIRDGLSMSVKPEFSDLVKDGEHRNIDQGVEYFASVAELTARATEMRRNVIEGVGNLVSKPSSAPVSLNEGRVLEAFGGKPPTEDQVLDFILGRDHNLTTRQERALTDMALGRGGEGKPTLLKVYNEVLDGEVGSSLKRDAFKNFMKFSLASGVVATGYGATQNEGQALNTMRFGGKLKVKKKAQEGMQVKKKNGDPKKESTGYARLDARLARMNQEAASDTTNYNKNAADRIQRQMQAESGGERNPDRAVSPAGARGRWQIMPATQKDMEDRGLIPTGLDPFNPNHSRMMRDAKINALMKLPFIANPPQKIPEVNRLARIYASYNFGEGNTIKALTKAKNEGVNIYGDPRLWMSYLPEETRGYLNKILFD